MFGYVKPLVPELRIKDFELYKSFYCGLCRTTGKKISPLVKISLSYDIVFLALLRIAFTGEKFKVKPFRCKLKPTKKRMYVTENSAMVFAAAASALLLYFKCLDDIKDTKNAFLKIIKYIPLPIFGHFKKRALSLFDDLYNKIKEPLDDLAALEKIADTSPDRAACCFGRLMGNVLSFGLDEKYVQQADIIGYHLGRWIYLVDCIDDFETDLRKNEKNVLFLYFKNKEELDLNIEFLKSSLSASLEEMDTAFKNIDVCEVTPIIANIINLGLCNEQERVIKSRDSSKPDK